MASAVPVRRGRAPVEGRRSAAGALTPGHAVRSSCDGHGQRRRRREGERPRGPERDGGVSPGLRGAGGRQEGRAGAQGTQ